MTASRPLSAHEIPPWTICLGPPSWTEGIGCLATLGREFDIIATVGDECVLQLRLNRTHQIMGSLNL